MADAKIVSLCDALVSAVETAWTGRGADDAVRRCYLAPVALDRATPFAGRKVYVFPTAYQDDPATRAEDSRSHSVAVWVVERYPNALAADSDDARTWLDARLGFVEEKIYDVLDFSRRTGAAGGLLQIGARRVWTESKRVTPYDWERLNSLELFMSELEFTFRELVT